MSMDTNKLFTKLELLDNTLDDLESQLEPLLAQTLPESVVNLETIQQAKLQVALPYLVYDLIFIYLKTRGIDPKTHPVITELDRIRQYFDKIKNAEDPAKRTTTLDKGAANRFIKNAIAQVRSQRPPGDNEGPSHIRFNEDGSAPISVKVTSKMIARAEYQKQLEAVDSEEESELEVIEDASAGSEASVEKLSKKDKGKGRAVDAAPEASTGSGKKRRRTAIDPWAGYGNDDAQRPEEAQTTKKSKSAQGTSKADAIMLDDSGSGRSTPLSADSAPKDKKVAKKARKKAQKAAVA